MTIPEGYIKKKGRTVPFGYEVSSIKGYLSPIPEQLEVLNKYIQAVLKEEYTLRTGYQNMLRKMTYRLSLNVQPNKLEN